MDPAFERREAFSVAGLHYRGRNADGEVTALWSDVDEYDEAFESLAGPEPEWFGVCSDFDEDTGQFSYLAGVAVDDDVAIPDEFARVDVPTNEYAVFTLTLDGIANQVDAVHSEWFPSSPSRRASGPEFERYDADFDGESETPFDYFVPVAHD